MKAPVRPLWVRGRNVISVMNGGFDALKRRFIGFSAPHVHNGGDERVVHHVDYKDCPGSTVHTVRHAITTFAARTTTQKLPERGRGRKKKIII